MFSKLKYVKIHKKIVFLISLLKNSKLSTHCSFTPSSQYRSSIVYRKIKKSLLYYLHELLDRQDYCVHIWPPSKVDLVSVSNTLVFLFQPHGLYNFKSTKTKSILLRLIIARFWWGCKSGGSQYTHKHTPLRWKSYGFINIKLQNWIILNYNFSLQLNISYKSF